MRIVVAEDEVLLRDGVVRLLESHGLSVVAQVGDARALVEAVSLHRPDLVVADVRMPPTSTDDGARAVSFLRERYPGLVATLARGRVEAFGYLLKDRVLETSAFVEQVREVAAGGTVIDPVVVTEHVQHHAARLASLSDREVEVLTRLATGRSNAGIASDLVVSRRTVDAHLRSIFAKLGLEAAEGDNQRVLAVLRWVGSARPDVRS